jgi:hypothetical protein
MTTQELSTTHHGMRRATFVQATLAYTGRHKMIPFLCKLCHAETVAVLTLALMKRDHMYRSPFLTSLRVGRVIKIVHAKIDQVIIDKQFPWPPIKLCPMKSHCTNKIRNDAIAITPAQYLMIELLYNN